jgi:uncharacterized membrane protein YdjX (TVP38/TMEM64 family)
VTEAGTTTGPMTPSFVRCVLVGLLAGLAATTLVIPAARLLEAAVDHTYPNELGSTHLAQATVMATLLASVTFYAVLRWTGKGMGLFATVTLGFAVGYSVVVLVSPPAPEFGLVVAPLHLVVGLLTVAIFGVTQSWVRTPTPPSAPSLGRYGFLLGGLLALLLVAFVLVEALNVPMLTDPTPWLDEQGVVAGSLGVGLLVVDVFIPVPSSGVMVAQGALFGVVLGTLLSLIGGLGATLLGFLVGRRSRGLVDRIVPVEEQERAERLLSRYGALAIIATRPVPMLAETTAIIAGTSRLGWRTVALAGGLGNLVPALAYALTGAVAASFNNQIAVFAAVIGVAAVFWLAGRGFGRSRCGTPSSAETGQ